MHGLMVKTPVSPVRVRRIEVWLHSDPGSQKVMDAMIGSLPPSGRSGLKYPAFVFVVGFWKVNQHKGSRSVYQRNSYVGGRR